MLCKVYFGLHFYLVRLVILREQPCTYVCFFFIKEPQHRNLYPK
jgi:hypothetical protein